MLRFRQVKLQNFLVFEDAVLDFATDEKATVIRAENGSGKTTLLRALEWAVYGDDALPGGRRYRLHPPSHTMPDAGPIEVSVELEVELDEDRAATIRRSTHVEPSADEPGWKRTLAGADFSWSAAEAGHEEELESRLPWRLREFFFTDGDKATDYVGGLDEAEFVSSSGRSDNSGLRGNVTDAIKSLLGLDLLESVRTKATSVSKDLDRRLAEVSGNAALAEASAKVEEYQRLADQLREGIASREAKRKELYEDIERLSRQRDELLQTGDPSELERQLSVEEERLRRAKNALGIAEREESASLVTATLTYAAGRDWFNDYVARAQPLVSSGVVPATYLWWVRQRLDEGVCMCGCSLVPGSGKEAQERHDAVVNLIARSEEESLAANHAGDLYYHLHAHLESIRHTGWIDGLRATRKRHAEAQDEFAEAEREIESLQSRLATASPTRVSALRDQIRTLETRDHALDKEIGGLERELEHATTELTSRQKKLVAARRKEHAAGDLGIKASLYEDVLSALSSAIRVRTDDDVTKLSRRMNALFKEMIGNHQVIREVRVTQGSAGFEVEGIGQDGRRMDVAHQFNGASKRALTNAFVLALGETAGVSAPNVIDTPLGMMDLSVRRRVFEIMQAESSQLVMLLTRSEIVGIEEALDDAFVQTVTNLGSGDALSSLEGTRSVVCDCSHREYCEICERVGDNRSADLTRRVA